MSAWKCVRFKLIMIIPVFRSHDSDDSGQEVKSSDGRVKPVFCRLTDIIYKKMLWTENYYNVLLLYCSRRPV